MSADRNLLFAILAMQMDFITRDQLIAGLNAWVLAKSNAIGAILEEQGAFSTTNRHLLEPLVDAHVQAHGGDPAKSLTALSSVEPVRQGLQGFQDADVQASINMFGRKNEFDSTINQPPPGDEPPRTAGTRFRIIGPHAEGGQGQVLLAMDQELGREVALKEIKPQFADRLASRNRFVFEAEVTGGLEHPGIVPVYSLGAYADGRPFYAMRFIRGDSLKEALQRFHDSKSNPAPSFDSLPFRQLLGRFIDVCEAIAYAHSRGVLHRDLKPGNIMLGKYGETLVVDWGLAKAVGKPQAPAERSDEPTLMPASGSGSAPTEYGQRMGTLLYMSPEQARGEIDHLGPASDVYSLGATLFEVLTGQPPFKGAVVDVLVRVMDGDIPTPRSVHGKVPLALDAVCRKAMALKPEARYHSAQELAAELEHWLADEPILTWREPFVDRARRWRRKHRLVVTSGLIGLVTTTIVCGIGLLWVEHERARAESARKLASGLLDDVITNEALATIEKQEDTGPKQIAFLRNMASYYRQLQVTPASDQRRHMAEVQQKLAAVFVRFDLRDDAEWSNEQAMSAWDELALENPADDAAKLNGAECRFNAAILLTKRGKYDAAISEYRAALASYQKVAQRGPLGRKAALGKMNVSINVADVLCQLQRPQEASAELQPTLAAGEVLLAVQPQDEALRSMLGTLLVGLGNAFKSDRQDREAIPNYQRALVIFDGLKTDFDTRRDYRVAAAQVNYNLGDTFDDRLKEFADAEPYYKAAATAFKQLAAEFPRKKEVYTNEWAECCNGWGRVLCRRGAHREAALLAEQCAISTAARGACSYAAACIFAVCAESTEKDPAAQSQFAARAVSCLLVPIRSGFCNRERIENDADLASLRTRSDYRAALAECDRKPQ